VLTPLYNDPNIHNKTLFGTTASNSTYAIEKIRSIGSSLENLSAGYATLKIGLEMADITNTTIQLDSTFGFLGFGLSYTLTSDFQPAAGSYNAKGTLILAYFNASIGTASADGMSSNENQLELEKRVAKVVEDNDGSDTDMSVIAPSLINEIINDANNKSLQLLLILAIVFVIIILYVIYRNFFDMGISFAALGLGILWMYGAGSWMGFTFNPITTMVPILIVGLGIDYSIHLIMRYKEELIENRDIKRSMAISITWVGTALLLATITTMAAFLSNLSSPMTLLFEFGILAAIGILGCFVSMTVFLTAAKQLRDGRRARKGKLKYLATDANSKQACKDDSFSSNFFCRGIAAGATVAARAPMAVIGITILITLASFYGAYNLETKFEFEDFLPAELDVTKDLNYLMNEFGAGSFGSEEIVFMLIKGDIADPTVLSDIERTVTNMEDDTHVNMKTVVPFGANNGNNGNGNYSIQAPDVDSILSLMQDYAMGTSFNETFAGYYFNAFDTAGKLRPETTREQIELIFDWLHTNTEKDTKFLLHHSNADDKYDMTVLRISVLTDMQEDKAFLTLDELNEDMKHMDDNTKVDSTIVTGGPILFTTIMNILNESQLRSLVITVIACAIILTFVFWFEKRSIALGVITTLPVVLVISWSLGVMFILNIPLNIMTITIASLTVGLGVTYGIHITHRFLENVERYPTIDEAGHNTVISTGIALFGAAATTIAAFGMLVFSLLPPMQQFGGISALTIFFSFVSCVFILPTFLRIWASYREKRGTLRSDDKLLQKDEEANRGKEEKDSEERADDEESKKEPPKKLKKETKSKSKSKSKPRSDD
jgi:predicted RND superfamily exporter protein